MSTVTKYKVKAQNELHFFIPAINNYTILCYSNHQLPKNESNEGGI